MAELKITTEAWNKSKRCRELEIDSGSGAYTLVDKDGWPEARRVAIDSISGGLAEGWAGTGSIARPLPDKLQEISSTADFGAVPGGTSDIKSFLDALVLATFPNNQGIVYLNVGSYRLATTWNPNDRSGGGMLLGAPFRGGTLVGGKGIVDYAPSAPSTVTIAPKIFWYGSASGIMIELDSIIGMAFEGLHFFGGSGTSPPSANRCGTIVNVSQRGALIGSGGHLFDRCSFVDAEDGLRFGDGQLTGAGNCDTTEFRSCNWKSVDRCVHLTHQQNLLYNFTGLTSLNNCKRFFHSETGGCLNVEFLNARDCGGTGTDDWMFDLNGGSSTGVHRIGPTRLEGSSGVGCKQFLRVNSGSCQTVVEGLYEAQSDNNITMFSLTGGQTILRGGKLATHDTSNPCFKLWQHAGSGTAPTLILEGVHFETSEFTYQDWFTHDVSAFPNIIVRDCFLNNGRGVPSFSTRLDSRLPVPLQAATTDGSTTVGMTLLRNGQTSRFDNCCSIPKGLHHIRAVIIAGVQSGTIITAKQLRATRVFDVFNDGSTITVSDTQTVGTDYNPDTLSFTLVVDSTRHHIRYDVVGKTSTNLYWRVEFTLLDTWSHYSI